MCGIVLAGGSLSSSDLEIFNQLLYCDVVRGVHATGVFAKRQGSGVGFVKMATQPYPFMQSSEYKTLSEGETRYVVPPAFLVGHNRHATRGNSDDPKNAHPFQHNHITLVHNGTLTNQSLLPDSIKFVVDSDNIAHSIAKIGAAETIQKLDGAFTLIWHDASDDSVHIIRNEERPFHLAQIGQADWFGASEEDMLMWILKRSKTHKNRITKHFECEVGKEYIFDVSGPTKKFVLKEVVEHDLPTFTISSRYYSNSYYNRGTSSSASSTALTGGTSAAKTGREAARKTERENQNALAIENGISARLDQRIQMTPHSWFPYTTGANSGKGRITGWVMETNGEYYEVDCHSCEQAMWETCCDDAKKEITGIVVNIQKVNGMMRVILAHPCIYDKDTTYPSTVSKPEPTLPNADDVPFDIEKELDLLDNLPEQVELAGGLIMTRAQYSKHDHSKCGGCDKVIPWADVVKGKALYAYNCLWHEDCLTAILDDAQGGNELDSFLCCCCGKEKGMSLLDSVASQDRGEDVCIDCGQHIREKRAAEKANKGKATADIYHNVKVIDKSAAAIKEDGILSKVFNESEFNQMIKMRGSDKATFSDLPKCYVEKRSASVYAYTFKRGMDKAVKSVAKAKEDTTDNKVVNFPVKTTTSAETSVDSRKSVSKTLVNGHKTLHITKALWNQLGVCNNCYATIPWRDADACALTAQNRIICPNCRGK